MLVTPEGGGLRGIVDDKLEHLGESRHVVVSVPHFFSGCQLVSSTNYLLTLPRIVAQEAAVSYPLVIRELPFEMLGFQTAIH